MKQDVQVEHPIYNIPEQYTGWRCTQPSLYWNCVIHFQWYIVHHCTDKFHCIYFLCIRVALACCQWCSSLCGTFV